MENKKKIWFIGIIFVIVLGFFAFQNWQKNSREGLNNKSVEKQIKKAVKQKDNVLQNKNGIREDDDYGNPDSSVVYYYGRECPHCKKVTEFLDKNDIYNKVDFAKKEVWHNKDNGGKLMEAAKKCGIDPSKIGVPFLFADGKCFIGDADVIAYFKEKAGI